MIYIDDLNKNIIPHYIPPKENELFSSWLCRLAIAHNIKPQSFIRHYFGRDVPVWNRDIDMNGSEIIFNFLRNHTPLKEGQIHNLFLKSYESRVFENVSNGGYTFNILPIGVWHRKRKRYGMQFCAKCLKKEEPYFKKEWRLISSILCVDCMCYLSDRCPHCYSPISYHRVNVGTNVFTVKHKPLYCCSTCGQDIRSKPHSNVTKLDLNYQIFVNRTIKSGYNELTQYSFFYIKALLILAQRLHSKSKNNRLYPAMSKLNDCPDLNLESKEVKFWSLDARIKTLPFIYRLLLSKDISNTFISNRVFKSYYDSDDQLPFWVLALINHY